MGTYKDVIFWVLKGKLEDRFKYYSSTDCDKMLHFRNKMREEFNKTFNDLCLRYQLIVNAVKEDEGENLIGVARAIGMASPSIHREFLYILYRYDNDPKKLLEHMTKRLGDACCDSDNAKRFDKVHWLIGNVRMDNVEFISIYKGYAA